MDFYPNDPTFVATSLAVTAGFLCVFIAHWKRHLETIKPFEDLPMPDKSHWLHGHAASYWSDDFQVGNRHLSVEFANEDGLTGHWLVSAQCDCTSTGHFFSCKLPHPFSISGSTSDCCRKRLQDRETYLDD